MEITILGTSSMVPTKERNVQSFYLEDKGEGILFDCGEGTQRQMNIASINRNKVRKILISHWHGDHVSGLIGILQTVGNQLGTYEDEFEKDKPELHLYGPKGTKEHMTHLMKATVAEIGKINIIVHELEMKYQKFFENENYELWCTPLRHSTPVLGFSFVEKDRRKINVTKAENLGLKPGPKMGKIQRGESITINGKKITPEEVTHLIKGKKITVIADTMPCNEAVELAEQSDLLICESTFESSLEEKARAYKHMTAEQAAGIAQQSGSKKLILTHFSQRYKQVDELVKEARALFPETDAAFDLMKIKI